MLEDGAWGVLINYEGVYLGSRKLRVLPSFRLDRETYLMATTSVTILSLNFKKVLPLQLPGKKQQTYSLSGRLNTTISLYPLQDESQTQLQRDYLFT